MVLSEVTLFTRFMNKIEVNDQNRSALNKSKEIARKIDKLKSDTNENNDSEINSLIDQLAVHTAVLFDSQTNSVADETLPEEWKSYLDKMGPAKSDATKALNGKIHTEETKEWSQVKTWLTTNKNSSFKENLYENPLTVQHSFGIKVENDIASKLWKCRY